MADTARHYAEALRKLGVRSALERGFRGVEVFIDAHGHNNARHVAGRETLFCFFERRYVCADANSPTVSSSRVAVTGFLRCA